MGRSHRAPLRALPRFFVPPSQLSEGAAQILGEDAHKIKRVLRLEPGDEIAVLDNSGLIYHCRLQSVESSRADAEILSQSLLQTESSLRVTIAQALAKGDKIEQVIRQNTEAGASAFLLMKTERCIVLLDGKKSDHKFQRYEKVAMEAAEQANRAKVPTVGGVLGLEQALEAESALKLFLYEGEGLPKLKQSLPPAAPSSVVIYVGPEGGFTEAEAALAEAKGALAVSLGARILRTETAALVALSQLLFVYEEIS